MAKPYMIRLSMKRPTADFIDQHLVEIPLTRASIAADVDLARQVARGLKTGKTRAQILLPLHVPTLRRLQDHLRALICGEPPHWVSVALDRLIDDVDKVISISIVDHLVRYDKQLGAKA